MKTKGTNGPILFIVHAVEDSVTALRTLVSKFERPIWGLQSIKETPHDSISDLTKFYVNDIRKVHKKKYRNTLSPRDHK